MLQRLNQCAENECGSADTFLREFAAIQFYISRSSGKDMYGFIGSDDRDLLNCFLPFRSR